MEGQQYLTVNPATFSDKSMWSYRDLQKIAMAVGIKANTKRDELITLLESWHRDRKDGTQTLVEMENESENFENFDMNVIGNNFAILAVQVKERSSKAPKRRASIVGLNQSDSGIVSPTLLRPLTNNDYRAPGTPGKSCLKKPRFVDVEENTCADVPATPKRLANICFSPFNGVKIIAHRDELAYEEYLYEQEMLREQEIYEEEKQRLEEEQYHSPVRSPKSPASPQTPCVETHTPSIFALCRQFIM